jgi:hypothetical protein
MEGKADISCSTLSKKKINNIIHKLTFWLYHCVFIGLYMIIQIKSKSEGPFLEQMNIYANYCSMACLWLFIAGGCHELIEFAIKSVYFFFKIIYMIYEACTKQEYEGDEGKDDLSSNDIIPKNMKLKQNNDSPIR